MNFHSSTGMITIDNGKFGIIALTKSQSEALTEEIYTKTLPYVFIPSVETFETQ
jgi:hypothetical protein